MLLVCLDFVVVAPIVASTIVAVAIVGTFSYQRWKQSKIDSARLVLDIDKEFRTKGFRRIHSLVIENEVDVTKEPHRVWLDRYLNHLTFVYGLYKDGVITKDHVERSYDGYLPIFHKNQYVSPYIEKYNVEFLYLYERLQYFRKTYHL